MKSRRSANSLLPSIKLQNKPQYVVVISEL